MKALTLTLAILALLGSAASGFFYYQIGNTKVELEKNLSAEQTKAASLKADLDKTAATLAQKNTQLESTDAELGDTKSKLTATEAKAVQLNREVTALKSTVAKSEEDTQRLNTDLASLRRELVQARLQAQVGSPEEIEKYKQTIASLESQVATLQASTSPVAGPRNPAAPALSERTASARVAVVGAKNSFVVLEIGTADGVAVGQKYSVTRDGQALAEAVVSEVKETYAIAQVTPSSIKGTLTPGDVATFQK